MGEGVVHVAGVSLLVVLPISPAPRPRTHIIRYVRSYLRRLAARRELKRVLWAVPTIQVPPC